jgi:type I restriction enzyme M protein
MSENEKQLLEKQLWNIANELRGKMNADEFRVYILGFIFYKYLSEKMQSYANKLLEADEIKYVDLADKEMIEEIKLEAVANIGFALSSDELFTNVAKKGENEFIIDDLQKIFNNIENSTMGTDSEDDFNDLFSDVDLTDKKLGIEADQRNTLISKILNHLDKIEFDVDNTTTDILGDAYEYLIAKFASGAGKSAGEFYTPQEVSTVLAKIVTLDKSKLKNVYDPTCGSGSLLLRVKKEMGIKNLDIYGQELNRTTYNLSRMNMIMHDIRYDNFDIKQEDTLEYPEHLDKKFEAIVANPPFSQHWNANDLKLNDDRFSQYGKLAPKTKADFAFIQHMIYQLDENGTMAVVVPHGVLFRGASEGVIRKYLIKNKN